MQETTQSQAGVGHRGPNSGRRLEDRKRGSLAETYLPLVDRVVWKMRSRLPSHADIEELRSIGVMGLMMALRNYRPSRAATFEGYALLKIRGAILDEMRRMDCMPRQARRQRRELEERVSELEQELGRVPTDEEIRSSIGLDVGEYDRLRRRTQGIRVHSLDADNFGEEGREVGIHERVADEGQRPGWESLEEGERVDAAFEQLSELPERTRKILALYYQEGLRLAEIAEIFGVTEARICQIHTRALAELRAGLAGVD